MALIFFAEERSTTTPKPQINGGSNSFSCEDSVFGCCPDLKTAALGENNGGCPSLCLCNKLGSIRTTCDPDSKECDCRPGVGGTKCDRCQAGYWGLARIVVDAQQGCRGEEIILLTSLCHRLPTDFREVK